MFAFVCIFALIYKVTSSMSQGSSGGKLLIDWRRFLLLAKKKRVLGISIILITMNNCFIFRLAFVSFKTKKKIYNELDLDSLWPFIDVSCVWSTDESVGCRKSYKSKCYAIQRSNDRIRDLSNDLDSHPQQQNIRLSMAFSAKWKLWK